MNQSKDEWQYCDGQGRRAAIRVVVEQVEQDLAYGRLSRDEAIRQLKVLGFDREQAEQMADAAEGRV